MVEKTREVEEYRSVKPTKIKKNIITLGKDFFKDRQAEKAEKKAAKKATKDKENQPPE